MSSAPSSWSCAGPQILPPKSRRISRTRPQFSITIQLHHWPTTCSPLSSCTQKRAVSCNMALEPFSWHVLTHVLLRLPLSHTEVTPVPLTFTERMHNNTPLPLPILLWNFRFLLPLSEGLLNPPFDLVSFWTMIESVCAFLYLPPCDRLDIYIHLTNQCRRVFSAPILQKKIIGTFRCYSIHSSFTCLPESEMTPAKYHPFIFILVLRCLLHTEGKFL